MTSRLNKLRATFAGKNIDAFVVTKDINITYLTEFPASESWLLVTSQKAFFLTDFRYVLEAKAGLKGISVVRYTKSFYETLFELAEKNKIKSLGFDEQHLNLLQYKALKKQAPKSVKLKAANQLVESLRLIKEPKEINKIKQALKAHHQALKFIKRFIKPGETEQAILGRLEGFVRAQNLSFSFDPIVAAGSNSCHPHAKVTTRKCRRDQVVLLDMGINFQGYMSDLTRMFFLGKIPNLINDVHAHVVEAQQRAISAIKAGETIAKVDDQARNYLKTKKLDTYFGHGLGHGVGLEIHEAPGLGPRNQGILKEGMVLTVEPAVYLPGKFGIRVEDMVLVTQKGCQVLSGYCH